MFQRKTVCWRDGLMVATSNLGVSGAQPIYCEHRFPSLPWITRHVNMFNINETSYN